jgi:ferric-dicitrate binding protein FerR (iron transport regulator)
MADVHTHEPKLAALHAYAEDRLRPAARARLERHLAGCATCREARLGIERYAKLLGEAHAQDTPELDWTRMQPALEREAQRLARARRVRRALPVGVALAAAACIALVVSHSARGPQAPLARAPLPAPAVAPPVPVMLASVTAIAGEVVARDTAGRPVPLTLDSQPTQGWTIETGTDGEAHLVLPGTAALIIPARSRLELRTLHAGDVEIALLEGQVVSQVHKRAPGERYDVLAGERRVAVRGTLFDVERSATSLAVQVDEGVVEVLASDGSIVTEVRAPGRWVEQRGAERITARLHRPQAKAPGAERWPELRVPTWPHVVEWELADADFSAASELAMRLPAGRLEVLAHADDGRHARGEITLDAVGGRFDPHQLRWANEVHSAPSAPRRPMDPNDASSVIRSAQPELQRCYERSMRGEADTSSNLVRVKLRIDIDARGHVRRAELVSGDMPGGTLGACIQQVAERWQFPPPGGSGLIFEAPLSFHPAR